MTLHLPRLNVSIAGLTLDCSESLGLRGGEKAGAAFLPFSRAGLAQRRLCPSELHVTMSCHAQQVPHSLQAGGKLTWKILVPCPLPWQTEAG